MPYRSAVGLKGLRDADPALIVAGIVVGAAGTLLTQLMAKAMNRPISGVLFSNFGGGGCGRRQDPSARRNPSSAMDAAMMLTPAKVDRRAGLRHGGGKGQHKIWELSGR